jgi:hypothetical protein
MGVEGFVLLHGNDVSLSGGFELLRLLGFAILLQLAQLGGLFLAAARQAGFLKLEVPELFFIFEEGFERSCSGAARDRARSTLRRTRCGLGENGGFQSGNAAQSPGRVGDGLDQIGFTLPDGLGCSWMSQLTALFSHLTEDGTRRIARDLMKLRSGV